MKGIIISAKNQKEFKFLKELLKRLGVSSTSVTEKAMEDLGLSKMLKSLDKKKKVSRESIMNKLKS